MEATWKADQRRFIPASLSPNKACAGGSSRRCGHALRLGRCVAFAVGASARRAHGIRSGTGLTHEGLLRARRAGRAAARALLEALPLAILVEPEPVAARAAALTLFSDTGVWHPVLHAAVHEYRLFSGYV